MFWNIKSIHFIGIGGIGMSGIAEVIHNLGFTVTGSDLASTSLTERLIRLGITVYIGHSPEQVHGANVVVRSTAVKDDNVEVEEAHRLQIPVIPRAEMLAELMRMKYGIAVGGSHGKTTATSLIAHVLNCAQLDPTIVIGGRLDILGSSAQLGKGRFMVAEADESDRTFLMLTPTIAVVTNADREHLDHYRDYEDLKEAFLHFANNVPFFGAAVLCLDDPGVREFIPGVKRRMLTYGSTEEAEVRAVDVSISSSRSIYRVVRGGENLGEIQLQLHGMHNVLNSLAAVSVGLDLDIDFPVIQAGIAECRGADRRFEKKGEVGGVMVVDDYAHHPTEILATLQTAKQVWARRTVVVFQPHRFTRVQHLLEEFTRAFGDADLLVITDIYAAGEEPLNGITGDFLANRIQGAGHSQVTFLPDFNEIVGFLGEVVREGDLVLTLGAGDIWKVGEQFLQRMSPS